MTHGACVPVSVVYVDESMTPLPLPSLSCPILCPIPCPPLPHPLPSLGLPWPPLCFSCFLVFPPLISVSLPCPPLPSLATSLSSSFSPFRKNIYRPRKVGKLVAFWRKKSSVDLKWLTCIINIEVLLVFCKFSAFPSVTQNFSEIQLRGKCENEVPRPPADVRLTFRRTAPVRLKQILRGIYHLLFLLSSVFMSPRS